VTLDRIALAVTVAGLVLAGAAVLSGQRVVTWFAIAVVAIAVVLRWRVRRRRAGGDRP
jgi:Flp pilus assembly protein TadB